MKKIIVSSFFFVSVFTGILLISQSSCKKETVNNIIDTPTIQGLWTGFQKNATDQQSWNLSINSDGTATYENTVSGVRQFCAGTWTLTNGNFTCTTKCIYGVAGNVNATQTFTASYNEKTGTLTNGNFESVIAGNKYNGTFTLTEVK